MRISFSGFAGLTMVSAFCASQASAQVTLELRPSAQTVVAGMEFQVGVYAVADPAELIGLAAIVVGWDPARVELLGNSTEGAHPWASSGFPSGGLNPGIENPNAWDDGTAFFQALVGADCNQGATSAGGLLITTFRFLAVNVGDTSVSILASFGGFNTTLWAGTGLAGCPADPVNFTIGPPVVASVIRHTMIPFAPSALGNAPTSLGKTGPLLPFLSWCPPLTPVWPNHHRPPRRLPGRRPRGQ
ncbi:MAG: hypothetical protein IIB57_14760 [Planctomycetes bacterium]|nr:hypothetical protein [Planctomycetota bacterium]